MVWRLVYSLRIELVICPLPRRVELYPYCRAGVCPHVNPITLSISSGLCCGAGCDYVLHSTGQLYSHKRKHERKDFEHAYKRFKDQQHGARPAPPLPPPSAPLPAPPSAGITPEGLPPSDGPIPQVSEDREGRILEEMTVKTEPHWEAVVMTEPHWEAAVKTESHWEAAVKTEGKLLLSNYETCCQNKYVFLSALKGCNLL